LLNSESETQRNILKFTFTIKQTSTKAQIPIGKGYL